MDFPSPTQLLNLDNPETIVAVLLRLADEMSTTAFYESMDIHAIGFGHLCQDSLNKLLLQASGPDSLEYEEVTGTDVNLAVLNLLLDHGADANCRDPEGNSPLYRAVLHDREKEAEFLLDHGARIDDVFTSTNDPIGETCLTSAVQMDNVDMVKLLVKNGARIPVGDVGHGLIWFAAFHARFEVLRLLVEEAGADVREMSPEDLYITDGLTEFSAGPEREGYSARLAAVVEGGIGHFYDTWKDSESDQPASPELRQNFTKLQDEIHRVVYLVQHGCPFPGSEALDKAVQLEAYFVLLSLMFWCIDRDEIPPAFPEELRPDYLTNLQWDGLPLLRTGGVLLGELIRRTRISRMRLKCVLRCIDQNSNLSEIDYTVPKLKHICMENLRRRLLRIHGADKLFEI